MAKILPCPRARPCPRDSSASEHPLAVLANTCSVDASSFPVAGTWFSVRQVADGITLITEQHVDSLIRANFYHVHGAEADLIVDTGTGGRSAGLGARRTHRSR
jgi:hypothetical protein